MLAGFLAGVGGVVALGSLLGVHCSGVRLSLIRDLSPAFGQITCESAALTFSEGFSLCDFLSEAGFFLVVCMMQVTTGVQEKDAGGKEK